MIHVTVRELRESLADLDDDLIVILASDSEGNRFTPMAGRHWAAVWQGHPTYAWVGDVVDAEQDPDDDPDDEVDRSGVPCVVLWPVN